MKGIWRFPILVLLAASVPLVGEPDFDDEAPDPAPLEAAPAVAAEAEADATTAAEAAVAMAEPSITAAERAAGLLSDDGRVHVYRVPITEAISKPNLFILRRSIKQAIETGVKVLVLDMDTPGGRLDITLEMMELLDRFDGETLTYVNKDAISAGAYISMATDAIYFAPDGVMGAAAVVSGTGEEIDESMKAKINSYLLARMRSYTDELKIDDKVLKESGELLSLTASEAVALYGSPSRPLLAEGIAGDLDELLQTRYGAESYVLESFEISWSEEAAKYLDSIAPLLLGLGLLLLFIEFKTPGFGFFGIAGLTLVGIVFASNYLAGLAGFEAIIFFILGVILIVVDVFLLPGTIISLLLGIILVLGSLLWSLSDIWPVPVPDGNEPGITSFTVEAESVWSALYQVLGAFGIAVAGLWMVWRFLPKTPVYRHLVHSTAGAMPDPVVAGGSEIPGRSALPDIGARGVVSNPLHPLGEVIIDGVRYQATVAVGALDRGAPVVVAGYRNFCLLVEPAQEDSA